ncbi:MAG: B(0,+)-type amino acid transporter [Amphiamblys sp. WSBS2006]|nr:MAG: B(0,+)-type amino acid transporter [Amphiamblys sp. WSBS2006]
MKLGVKDGIIFMVGNMVGCGIFMSPEIIGEKVGNELLTLMFWMLGGVVALLGAFCYVELGILFPEAGGEGLYLSDAYHPYVGAVYYLVSIFISFPGATAVMLEKNVTCLLYGFFVSEAIDAESAGGKWLVFGISVGILAVLVAVNILWPKYTVWISRTSIVFKVLSIGLTLFAGVFCLIRDGVEKIEEKTGEVSKAEPAGVLYSATLYVYVLLAALWSYDGWNTINLIGGSVKNPKKTFPLVLGISIPVVMCLYLALNAVYLWAAPAALFAETTTVKFVSASLVERVFSTEFARWVYPVFVFFAIIGSVNGCFICSAYVTQATAQCNYLPAMFAQETKDKVPAAGVLLQGALTVFFAILPLTSISSSASNILFTVVNMIMWVSYGLAACSVLVFRVKLSDVKRAFSVPLPVPVLFTLVASVIVLTGAVSFVLFPTKTNPFAS